MRLGIPSVRELYARLTSSEITEWIALYRLDPWDGARGDLRAAIVASTVANVNRGKNSPPMKPGDFMPDFERSNKSQTAEDIFQRLGMASAMTEGAGGPPPAPLVRIITPEEEGDEDG